MHPGCKGRRVFRAPYVVIFAGKSLRIEKWISQGTPRSSGKASEATFRPEALATLPDWPHLCPRPYSFSALCERGAKLTRVSK